MQDLVLTAAIVLSLGIAAQWLAWRFKIPAIVLLAVGGIVAGPVTGILDPHAQLGEMLEPLVAVAVAIILFEGGISLDLRELRGTASGVRRLTLVGAPVGWLAGTIAAHYVAGLSWPTAAVLGGILVVTGPTVIAPLLRQAKLDRKPAITLKWEGIVNDPLGALFAVLAYEYAIAAGPDDIGLAPALGQVALGAVLAAAVGLAAGSAIAWAFRRGHVPEFLKAPLMIGAVLACFAGTNAFVEETGLIAVTVLGVTLGNSKVAALEELRRIKEVLATILVSGVFVLLTATLNAETLAALDWRHAAYVVAVLVIVRPVTVLASLIGTGVPWSNRALLAWIAPRGIVAVAITGLFGERLVAAGYEDGALLVPLGFAVVLSTVTLHGFSLRPLARLLKLTSDAPPGFLVVGAGAWTTALAHALVKAKVPVVLADRSWARLRAARHEGLPVYHGEVLSDATEIHLDLASTSHVIAATDNDAYNTLICNHFGPDIGRSAMFQVAPQTQPVTDRHSLALGGMVPLAMAAGIDELDRRQLAGWRFSRTRITEDFTEEDYRRQRPAGSETVLVIPARGRMQMPEDTGDIAFHAGDTIIAFGPPADAPAETTTDTDTDTDTTEADAGS